jgi:hypothetical protein
MAKFENTGVAIPEGMSVGEFFSQAAQEMMKSDFGLILPGKSDSHSFRTLHLLDLQNNDFSYIYRATTHSDATETDGLYIPHPLNGLNRFHKPIVNYRHYTRSNAQMVVLRQLQAGRQHKVELTEDYSNEDDEKRRRQVELLIIDVINLKNNRLYVPLAPESNVMGLTVDISS